MVIALTFIVMGSSYAWFSLTLNGSKENVIKSGNLTLMLDDATSPGINLTNGYPTLDEVGIIKEGYTFSIENIGNINSEYTIYLDDIPLLDGETKLDEKIYKV